MIYQLFFLQPEKKYLEILQKIGVSLIEFVAFDCFEKFEEECNNTDKMSMMQFEQFSCESLTYVF